MSDSTTFRLEIITPERVLVSEDVDSVVAPGSQGEFQILPGHTHFLTSLKIGHVVFDKKGKKNFLSISGGFCEVMPSRTVILARTAETSDSIDKARALAAKERAAKRLASKKEITIDEERAKIALLRALNRLQIAEMK
ncbi:MAG: F0F1 ATP synthase subunit epsilon [Candidatus Latescibacterota bacterium]